MADELDIPMPSMMPAGATWRNTRRGQGLDGVTRRLVLFAGVIGGGLLLLVGIWSLSGHHGGAVPVVEADPRPLRTKPENAGGLQLAGQDDAILSGSSGAADAMAPPPESPAPQALRDTPPSPAVPPPVAPTVASPPAAAPTPLAAPPVVAAPDKPLPVARIAPPVPSPISHLAGTQVQLAAMTTEEAARAEWQRLSHKFPELLGGRTSTVSKLQRPDGKTFFRLRTGGFSDIAQATSFCGQMRAKGVGCTLGGV